MLSPEDANSFLTDKPILLANPGTKVDDLYYSPINSTVDLVECTFNVGRLITALSNAGFGSSAQATIPNSSFVGTVYLHLELPAIVANQTLCRGWGFGAIQTITYLFGSSNVPQVQITGQSVFHSIMMQCETSEKRTEMFRLAGNEQLIPTAGSVTADLILPFPFSSASGLYSKLPFDTSLLSNPIQITVTFNSSSAIYGGLGARPTAFSTASLVYRQGNLTNKGMSLRNVMRQNPDKMYPYPFIYSQSNTVGDTPGSIDPNSRVTMNLLGFPVADLLSIALGVIPVSRISPASNGSPNPMAYEDISNIRLLFNGEVWMDLPGSLYKLTNMNSLVGSGFVQNSIIDPSLGVSPFSSSPSDTYIIVFDFSRVRSLSYEGQYANVKSVGNNAMQLEFTTKTTGQYRVFATYYFNSNALIGNGESRIYNN